MLAIECDAGAGVPLGIVTTGDDATQALLRRMAQPLGAIGASEISHSDETGADLIPMHPAGVPQLGLKQDVSDYFEWHHTDGDTADKIDPDAIGKASAALVIMAAQLADSDEKLARVPPRTPAR